jgi:hypothetical protein
VDGKDVGLVALPNAGHGWDNEGLAQTRFAFRKLVQHFDRHLKGIENRWKKSAIEALSHSRIP